MSRLDLLGLASQGEQQENYRTIEQGVTSNRIVAIEPGNPHMCYWAAAMRPFSKGNKEIGISDIGMK